MDCTTLRAWEAIVGWYLQQIIIPGFFRWCRIPSIHSRTFAFRLGPRPLDGQLRELCEELPSFLPELGAAQRADPEAPN